MKKLGAFLPLTTLLFVLASFLTSCEAIGGIFKAGMWTGILFVAGIIALVIFIIAKLGGKKD
ncbi:MAG: hypothetical protein ABI151_02615 [Chitinophagaceae bacterium]